MTQLLFIAQSYHACIPGGSVGLYGQETHQEMR